jgi:hypothetical protein
METIVVSTITTAEWKSDSDPATIHPSIPHGALVGAGSH